MMNEDSVCLTGIILYLITFLEYLICTRDVSPGKALLNILGIFPAIMCKRTFKITCKYAS